MTSERRPLRVLCLDGGGIKGYTSLLILKRLFRELQSKDADRREVQPYEVFDLIVGTSTGGIIATMLGRLHMSIDDCLQQYQDIGKKVFGKRPSGGKLRFYDVDKLESEIKTVVLSRSQVSESAPTNLKFCPSEQDSTCSKVLLCVTRSSTQQPEVLRSYQTWAPSEENYDCDIWEAAAATAAAPMYFKPILFARTGEKWSDGGLKRNNPINEALNEIGRDDNFRNREIGCVVSIGTGITETRKISSNLLVFLHQAVKMMTWSEEIADTFIASELGARLAKSKRYFRFNVQQGLQQFEMDELDRTEEMDALTKDYLRKADCAAAMTDCAESLFNPEGRLRTATAKPLSVLNGRTCRHYMSRQEYMSTIISFFSGSSVSKRFVLWGTGGMGKTQLALEYAMKMLAKSHVFWVRCEQYASFVQDFCKISATINPASMVSHGDDGIMLQKTRLLLESLRDFLLILDNADDLDEFLGRAGTDADLASWLPERGDILITTRDPRFLGGFVPAQHGKRVCQLERDDARQLLLNSVPSHLRQPKCADDAEELLEQLADLPLAIAQAAANIQELQIDLSTYLTAYKDCKERAVVMQEPFFDNETNDDRNKLQSVYITWEISFNILEIKNPLSAVCLQAMALFHWTSIPSNLLTSFPSFEHMTPVEFRAATKKLLHLSLVEEVVDDGFVEYSLHRVVHEVILDPMRRKSPATLISLLATTAQNVADIFPFVDGDEKAIEFSVARYLLPHALRQLDLMEEMTIISRPRATLLQSVSNYLMESGQTFAATHFSAQALDVATQVWPPDDLSLLYVHKTAAKCLLRDARYADSEKLLLMCLEMLEYRKTKELLNENQRLLQKVAISHLYDQTLFGQHKFEQLTVAYQNTYDLAIQAGYSRRVMRPLLNSIANTLVKTGDLEEARRLNDSVIEDILTDPDALCKNKVFLGTCLNVRVQILQKTADKTVDKDEKEDLATKIHNYRKEVFGLCFSGGGIENLDTWKAANNLLGNYLSRQEWRPFLELVLKVLRLALDSDVVIQGQFRETFDIFASYALCLLAAAPGESLSRIRLLKRLLQVFTSAQNIDNLGQESSASNSMAVYLQWSGRYQEAETILRHIIQAPDSSVETLGGLPHYNLMLAIAIQDGRLAEAFQYKREHQHLIAEEESIYGTLEQRVERWKLERQLYTEAQNRIASGDCDWQSEWCQSHKAELKRAQMRWGWLYDEVNPWLDSDDESDMQSDRDVKGKGKEKE